MAQSTTSKDEMSRGNSRDAAGEDEVEGPTVVDMLFGLIASSMGVEVELTASSTPGEERASWFPWLFSGTRCILLVLSLFIFKSDAITLTTLQGFDKVVF